MEEKRQAYSEPFMNTREMVRFINSNDIQQSDIVTVLELKGELLLVYFK